MKDDVYYRLNEVVNLAPTDSLDYFIAKQMLRNFENTIGLNIEVVAEICHTSTASISRFCQKIGYANFRDMKLEMSNAATIPTVAQEKISYEFNPEEMKKTLIEESVRYHRMMKKILGYIDFRTLYLILNKIAKAKKIIILCAQHDLSAIVLFQHFLSDYGKDVTVFVSNTQLSKIENYIDETDLVLFVCYRGGWLLRNKATVGHILSKPLDNVVMCYNAKAISHLNFGLVFEFYPDYEVDQLNNEISTFIFSLMKSYLMKMLSQDKIHE